MLGQFEHRTVNRGPQAMLPLYPEIRPYAVHRIAVSAPHELYVEECGNPDGIPVIFVHGGPGAGCHAFDRRFFDPDQYRIVLFDQRGAGRSTPHAELQDNDTDALIEDIETIRQALSLNSVVLFGGSWGTTLGLLYAQQYPDQVQALILRGIFLCRRKDIAWLYESGASRLFPDHWADFVGQIPEVGQEALINSYHRLLTGDNELARMAAAKAWCLWEARCATLRPNHNIVDHFSAPHVALGMARIATHYLVNDCFIEEGKVLEGMGKIASIPGVIVHGRFDVICPIDNAFALSAAWPQAELQVIRNAGHSASEPGVTDALIRATRALARQLSA